MDDDGYLSALRSALGSRYRIEGEIGRGAYARVFRATKPGDASPVAVKVLKPEWSQAVARERFLREIQVTGQLHHANILPLLDSGELGGFLFYVTPFVAGETLRALLQRRRQLELREVRRLTRDVANGLSAAHAHGILHRDIKPENILLDGDRAVVADFGVAKAFTDSGVDTITSTGLGIGTPPYMSPEQASGERHLDERSDVYSLACLVFELLAGETPYTGPTPQIIVAKKLSLPVPSVRVLRSGVPAPMDDVIRRGLAKVPADRYGTIEAFMTALDGTFEASGSNPVLDPLPLASPSRRRVAITAGALAIIAAGAWIVDSIRSPRDEWPGGRPPAVAVIPMRVAASTEQEQALTSALADAITRELNEWESIRAVPGVSLAGPIFDLNLDGPVLEREADALRVARQVGVQGMLTVLVRARGDSVHAEASLFEVAGGRPVERPVHSSAIAGDLAGLARPLLSHVLGLGASDGDPIAMRRLSAYPEALVAHLEGVQHMDRGRLPDAELAFRRALAVDSAFALAQHHLALTLFLASSRTPRRLTLLAPEIAQLSTGAAMHTAGLGLRDSLRVTAFHAFQAGDYDGARQAYAEILTQDPADVYALLMRGTVELRDPWLVALPDSAFRPRGNPNVAIRDLGEILRLRPTFDLGYDLLSDVHRRISDAAGERTVCAGFELPRLQVKLPWDAATPEQQRSYCPVIVADSVAYVARGDLAGFGLERARAGASRFFERYLALVRRWATYAPNEVRPQEEMVRALLARRRQLGLTAPERLAALADSALAFARRALALKRDTTVDELARLGNIQLATGDEPGAVRTTEGALRLPAAVAPHILAANPFLTAGQPGRAMAIRTAAPFQRFIADPVTGALIPFGGAEAAISRIAILGATGVGGPALDRELREVARRWTESAYTDHTRRELRNYVTMELALALSLDPARVRSWDREVMVTDPLWRALVLSTGVDPAAARPLLLASLDSVSSTLTEATRSYLQGVVAARSGDHHLAIARWSRIDSLPLATDVIDLGWGVRSLSRLRRAESYLALGEAASARAAYRQFASSWAAPDSLTRELVREAARRFGQPASSP